ncbi:hypothetical protein BD560DRAFT_416134 [Blakeslea trispora]|nr:hypothetical protein BD560DRAFT_416134 [Blakeslea trispora]
MLFKLELFKHYITLSCYLLYLTAIFIVKVDAFEPQPRRAANCAYLFNKIYCYGGYSNNFLDSNFIMLDVNKNAGKPFKSLTDQWEMIHPEFEDIISGRRDHPQTVALPDGKSFLVQGGFNYENSSIANQTLVYDAEINAWSAKSNYYEAMNGGNRQIYFGNAVYVDSLKSVAFYGGHQQHAQNNADFIDPDGTRIKGLTLNSDGYIVNAAGFYFLTLYNVNKNSWNIPAQTDAPVVYYTSQSATHVPQNKTIYYMGGEYYNATDRKVYGAYMDYIITYETASGIWKYAYSKGDLSPSMRTMHTATLLPDEHTILLYGGRFNKALALSDYCYTFNTQTYQWKRQNLNEPAGLSAPRSEHSAVLIDNSTLGIFFGIDKTGNLTNEMLLLDIQDIDHLSFMNSLPNHINTNTSSGGNKTPLDTNPSSPSNDTLNNSTTIGIAVGVSCGVLVIIAAIVWFIFFKRKQRSSQLGVQESSNTNLHAETEMVEVDWDKIDDTYYSQTDLSRKASPSEIRITQIPNEHIPLERTKPSSSSLIQLSSPAISSQDSQFTKTTIPCTKPDISPSSFM